MDIASTTAQIDRTTPPSRWARAMQDDRDALSELAGSYWYCVYAWWRRAGREDAEAATKACFTRWLTDAPPRPEHTGAARFREWLRARLAELSEQGVASVAEPAIEIAPEWAEQRYTQEPEGAADGIFQRRWALTVLELAMDGLRAEYAARGQDALFVEMSPYAGFEAGGNDERYEATARRMGFTVGAARKAVFEFRSRHRELLRGFIADTVAEPLDIDSELTVLLCACDMPGAAGADAPLPTALRSFKPDELLARAMQTVKMTSGTQGGWQPPSIEEAARLFPNYEVIKLLGRGGMGAVYQARQIELDRLVAIKLLPLEISVGKDFADRFRREARAMAKLHHPNIITVFDFGTTREGHLFFAMEYVEGANLAEIIRQVGLNAEQALSIVEQVCTALAYAHGKGIVHRDIKPANVMIDTESHVKVADFGLARLTDPAAEQMGHTITGTIMGTPAYMAPEQMNSMDVDHCADIYSLGVMMYEMLCREVPRGIFRPPSQRIGCDARIDGIVIKAMQQQPERRYQSTTEMKADVIAARTPLATVPTGPTQVVHPHPVAQPALPEPKAAVMKAITPPGPTNSKMPLYAGVGVMIVALIAAALIWARQPKPGGTRSGVSQTSVGAGPGDQGRAGARPSAGTPAASTKDAPFVNTLGMKFVPVPGTRVLFSIWETRVQDYAAYARVTGGVIYTWTKQGKDGVPVSSEAEYPVVGVNWADATVFCKWLTEKETADGELPTGAKYRLPTDEEWSRAVGLAFEQGATPEEKSENNGADFPWGIGFPPPEANVGNYADAAFHEKFPNDKNWLKGYKDGYATTAQVGSFAPNKYGIYDLGGNAWEWCRDSFAGSQNDRVLRGAAWNSYERGTLLLSHRIHSESTSRTDSSGFRCVLEPAPSPAPAATTVDSPAASAKSPALTATAMPATPSPAPAAPATPSPATPAPTAATPAPAVTAKPLSDVEKWLVEVDAPQQKSFQEKVAKPFDAGAADVRARYLAALDAGIAKASAAAKLQEALELRSERQSFEKMQTIPPEDTDGPSAATKTLRTAFRLQLARLEQDRAL